MQAITRITKHYNAQLFLSSSLLTLSSANYDKSSFLPPISGFRYWAVSVFWLLRLVRAMY